MLFALGTFMFVAGVGSAISQFKLLGVGIRAVGGVFSALFFLAALIVLILMFFVSIIS